jgi:hypothetical protein
VTLRPSLNGQIDQWRVLFPFEQKELRTFFEGLASFSPEELKQLTAPLRLTERRMGVDTWRFSQKDNTLEDTAHLARSAFYAEWRNEVQCIFRAIERRTPGTSGASPSRQTLILIILPKNLPVAEDGVWQEWGFAGHPIAFHGNSEELCQRLLTGARNCPSLFSVVTSRGNRSSSDFWLIDADAALNSILPVSSASSVCSLSYSELNVLRTQYLAKLNTIPRDLNTADQTLAVLRQTKWDRWCPPELAREKKLQDFVVQLFLSGNGSPVFSDAFVEWAAAEALRRARPDILIARFGIRMKPKLFTSIAVFENQDKISTAPDIPDPEGSALDASMLARYVWLAARRYREYENALCLCVSDHLQAGWVVAPQNSQPEPLRNAYTPLDLHRLVARWLQT